MGCIVARPVPSSFGLIGMRWTALNALGGLAWLAGIVYAKGSEGPAASYLSPDGHNLAIGALMGAAGLGLLLWANFRTAA